MATAAKFRIDVDIHDLLNKPGQQPPVPAAPTGLVLPDPVYPQFPERLNDPGRKVDGFWLPLQDKTVVQVRFYGRKVLTIEHRDYVVKGKNAI